MRAFQHKVVLFGSQAQKIATIESDVDIVLVPMYNKRYDACRILQHIAAIVERGEGKVF